MPEMQKRDGHGEAESYTESGEEEAKGGAKMQKINREDVVQAALIVERWCEEHYKYGGKCDCPFAVPGAFVACRLGDVGCAEEWELEEFLRARGLKRD